MSNLKDKFETYHSRNKHVFEEFCKHAIEIAKIRDRFSAYTIFEHMRWNTAVRGEGDFKISNDFIPFYSRLFLETYPEYKGLFKTSHGRHQA